MFRCATCGGTFELPTCGQCSGTVAYTDGVWQMTDDPDLVTEGEGDKYISYGHIGESYSGKSKYASTCGTQPSRASCRI